MLTKINTAFTVQGDEGRNLGLVHVYTGDGKGKTTASLGLAMRALGSNLKVCIIQFMKSGHSGEISTAKDLGLIIQQFGAGSLKEKTSTNGRFIFYPDSQEKEAAVLGWQHAKKIIADGEYDIVILDEVNCALNKGFIPLEEVLEVVKSHDEVELVFTGRDAPKELMEQADYVSSINNVKHPWQKGIKARKGIEY